MIPVVKSKKEKIFEKALEIGLNSTSHGLPNLIRTDKFILKLIWLLILLTGLSMGIFTKVQSIMNYLKYDVVTSIKVITEVPTQFPAVTFFILRNRKANLSLSNFSCNYNTLACESIICMNQDDLGYVSYTFKCQQAFQSGIKFGLYISLNLSNIPFDNNISNIKKKTLYDFDGVRVIIHNQTYDPEYYLGYSDNGLNVAPGFYYEIAVKRLFTYKLGRPYNSCLKDVKSFDSFESNVYKYMLESTNYSYTFVDCISYCASMQIYKYLNVTTYKLDHYENIIEKHPEYEPIIRRVYQNMILKGTDAKTCENYCPLECDSVKYETSHSFTKYSEKYQESNKNMISFRIFYEKLDYTVMDEVAQMNVFDLISNVGGNLGLFIGISFISFAEVFELLVEIIYILT